MLRLPATVVSALALACVLNAAQAPSAHAAKDKPKDKTPAKDKSPATETVTVKAGGLELQVPKTWVQKPPSSGMRLAEFQIPHAEGESDGGELAIFHFGPGGGGGVQANIDRWIAQFDKNDVKVVLTQGQSKQGDYIFATISGTFNMPVGPPMSGQSRPVPDAQVLGVIVQNATGPYFIKLWGTRKTVEPTASVLRAALGATGKEKPYP